MKKSYYIASLLVNIILLGLLIVGLYNQRERIAQKYIDVRGHADIAMLGDSHTYLNDWSSALGSPILRSAREGFTAWQIQNGLMKPVLKAQPRLCFVLCGTNDTAYPHYKLSDLLLTYTAIADTLTSHRITPVFQTVPYKVSDHKFNQCVDSVNQQIHVLCQNRHIAVFDLNQLTASNKQLNTKYALPDNTHLNREGYQVWSKKLNEFVAVY